MRDWVLGRVRSVFLWGMYIYMCGSVCEHVCATEYVLRVFFLTLCKCSVYFNSVIDHFI